jgi:hypothetical protein
MISVRLLTTPRGCIVLKLDDYLHQKTGTLHVSENTFELGAYTALGKFDDLATARRAIESMEKSTSDTPVTLARSALESMPGAVSEDAAGFIARRTLNGAVIGASIAAGVALLVVLLIRPFEARNLLVVLFGALFGAIMGGLFNVYARLGDDSEIHEAPVPSTGQFYVALQAADRNDAQRFADLMSSNGATDVEVLDRSNEM